jgi:hypothetical protein
MFGVVPTVMDRFPVRRHFGRVTAALSFILLVTPLPVGGQGDTSKISKHDPLWVVDLGSEGLGAERNLFLLPVTIDFVDSGTLVVAWFVSQQPQSSSAAAHANLEAVYLDATTGKQKAKSGWAASSWPRDVHITANGNLLVRDGPTVRLFSSSFNDLREKAFPMSNRNAVTISPGGRRVLVCPASQDGSQAQLLDADTFQVLDTFPIDQHCQNYAVGDKLIAMWGDKASLSVRSPGEPWRPVPIVLPTNGTNKVVHGSFGFLNDTTLTARASLHSQSILVSTIEGKTLFTMSQPKEQEFGSIITSRGGQYFGAVEERFRGLTIEQLDMYAFPSPDQFVVYSLSDLKEIFRVKVESISPWYPKRLVQKYAISPDGKLVAVMTNGVIRSYVVR